VPRSSPTRRGTRYAKRSAWLLGDLTGTSSKSLVVTNDDIKEIVTALEMPKVKEEPIKREEPRTSPFVLNFETLLNDTLKGSQANRNHNLRQFTSTGLLRRNETLGTKLSKIQKNLDRAKI